VTHTTYPLIGIPASTASGPEAFSPYTYRFEGSYTAALAAAGGTPVVIPLNLPLPALRSLFERLDGLLLAGGVDVDPAQYGEPRHPDLGQVDAARDHVELTLTRWALDADLPVFGICRGIQLLNVAAGGSLWQDIPAQLHREPRHNYTTAESPRGRATHGVQVAGGSRLAGVMETCDAMVNSYHHQAVKQVAAGFVAVAHSFDGIIEGIEDPARRYVVGVQWHPEGMVDTEPTAPRLFAAFVAAARERAAATGQKRSTLSAVEGAAR